MEHQGIIYHSFFFNLPQEFPVNDLPDFRVFYSLRFKLLLKVDQSKKYKQGVSELFVNTGWS